MRTIQQMLWELRMDYIGHPYYVSGNAILHALGQHLKAETHAGLSASHGAFVPGQFGRFPNEHSQSGVRPYLGSSLPDVESYEDLFLQRGPVHPWLLDARARDALNTHDLRVHAGHPTMAHETIMGRRENKRKQQQTTKWYVHAYLHTDGPGTLPVGKDVLDYLQFGGNRNYGYGEVALKETQVVDLDALDYSQLDDADTYLIKVVTPFVLESDYPDASDQSVPWWWEEERSDLRARVEKILKQHEVYTLQTVDHGQVVSYEGDRPVETAKNGIFRVGSHSKYGFGELQVKAVEPRSDQYSDLEETSSGG